MKTFPTDRGPPTYRYPVLTHSMFSANCKAPKSVVFLGCSSVYISFSRLEFVSCCWATDAFLLCLKIVEQISPIPLPIPNRYPKMHFSRFGGPVPQLNCQISSDIQGLQPCFQLSPHKCEFKNLLVRRTCKRSRQTLQKNIDRNYFPGKLQINNCQVKTPQNQVL